MVLFDRSPELYLVDPYERAEGNGGRRGGSLLNQRTASRLGRPYLAEQLAEAGQLGLDGAAGGPGGPTPWPPPAGPGRRTGGARPAWPPRLIDRVRGHLAAFRHQVGPDHLADLVAPWPRSTRPAVELKEEVGAGAAVRRFDLDPCRPRCSTASCTAPEGVGRVQPGPRPAGHRGQRRVPRLDGHRRPALRQALQHRRAAGDRARPLRQAGLPGPLRRARQGRAGHGQRGGWPVPYWDMDAAMAVMLMLLTAVDEGVGAWWFGVFHGARRSCATSACRPAGASSVPSPSAGRRPTTARPARPGHAPPAVRPGRALGPLVAH